MMDATKKVACAMMECVTYAKSTVPTAVVVHVRDTILAVRPELADLIEGMSGLGLAQAIRPHIGPQELERLVENDDLQRLLRDDPFQTLISHVYRINKTDRTFTF
jgi:hypothetical protein